MQSSSEGHWFVCLSLEIEQILIASISCLMFVIGYSALLCTVKYLVYGRSSSSSKLFSHDWMISPSLWNSTRLVDAHRS